jgi:putative mRNA 3-end processing factor
MKFIFRGGAQEVGRSCIELQTQGDRYLFDCGVKFTEDGFAYPEKLLDVPDIDGVFLSHAHLDHSGALPFFEHKDLQSPIFCTSQTHVLAKLLLKDSFEVARIRNLHPAFGRIDLKEVKKDMHIVQFDKPFNHKKLSNVTFFNAGHIPGSASILVEAEGKKVLYSGDINLAKTMLMTEANTNFGPVDILIVESTYGYRTLPNREEVEKRFLQRVKEVVKGGGSVLIPVFAVGRAQEILQIFAQEKWTVPIYYDGMAKKATQSILANPSTYLKNKDKLAHMFYDVVQFPKNERERNEVASGQGIFVTTSGMLQGGPVLHYLKHMWHDERSAVFLSGYQCKRTNGRDLLDNGYVYLQGWKTKVHCQVEKFDFSGHADRTQLENYIKIVNPRQALIVQHGDPESVHAMVEWAEKTLSCKVFGPKVLDELEF